MIKIKDTIFNENEIQYIMEYSEKELQIMFKDQSDIYVEATFDDIEWNYQEIDNKQKSDKSKRRAYKRIEELEEENIMLRSAWDDMFKKWESQVNKVGKAIEYIGNGNIGIPTKTREKIIKILKAEEK